MSVGTFLIVAFLFGLVFSANTVTFSASDDALCSQFPFKVTTLSDKYRICWRMINGNTTMDMLVQVICNGYVAWGIGDQKGGGMVGGADIIQGAMVSGRMTAYDLWSTTTGEAPSLDPVQNVASVSGGRSGGVTTLRFQRQVDTGDSSRDRVIAPGILEMLAAYSKDDNIRDKHADAALFYVDMFTGQGPPPGAQTSSQIQIDPAQYQYQGSFLGGLCKFYWKMVGTTDINIAMSCQTQGWISFGITDQKGGGMTNADMMVGRVQGGVMTVQDYWSPSQNVPTLDKTQSLTAVQGSRIGSVTTMMFSRKLVTGDVNDRPIVSGLMECIVAFHSTSDLFVYHENRNRGIVYLDFFSGIAPGSTTAPPAAVDTTWNPAQYPNRFDAVPGTYELYWSLDSTTQIVNFAIRVATTGWAALGVATSSAGAMAGSDIMMASFDATGSPVIQDQQAVGISTPVDDTNKGGTFSFTSMAGSKNSTGLTIKWARKLDTGDTVTDVPLIKGLVTLTLAWGATATPSYHGTSRAAVQVDLGTGAATSISIASNDPMKIAHGSLMIFAFGLLMAAGILIAIAVPKNAAWWFPAHWILQAIAGLIILISFFVILAQYQQNGVPHFRLTSATFGAHAIIGIIVIGFVFIQIVLGVVADRVWQKEHKETGAFPETKNFPDRTHWWVGRAVFVLACINIYLGLAEMNWTWQYYISWMFWCLLLIGLFVAAYYIAYKNKAKGHGHSAQVAASEKDLE